VVVVALVALDGVVVAVAFVAVVVAFVALVGVVVVVVALVGVFVIVVVVAFASAAGDGAAAFDAIKSLPVWSFSDSTTPYIGCPKKWLSVCDDSKDMVKTLRWSRIIKVLTLFHFGAPPALTSDVPKMKVDPFLSNVTVAPFDDLKLETL
jgi:hypothetical protein